MTDDTWRTIAVRYRESMTNPSYPPISQRDDLADLTIKRWVTGRLTRREWLRWRWARLRYRYGGPAMTRNRWWQQLPRWWWLR